MTRNLPISWTSSNSVSISPPPAAVRCAPDRLTRSAIDFLSDPAPTVSSALLQVQKEIFIRDNARKGGRMAPPSCCAEVQPAELVTAPASRPGVVAVTVIVSAPAATVDPRQCPAQVSHGTRDTRDTDVAEKAGTRDTHKPCVPGPKRWDTRSNRRNGERNGPKIFRRAARAVVFS